MACSKSIKTVEDITSGFVRYFGSREDLIHAGVATPDMFPAGGKKRRFFPRSETERGVDAQRTPEYFSTTRRGPEFVVKRWIHWNHEGYAELAEKLGNGFLQRYADREAERGRVVDREVGHGKVVQLVPREADSSSLELLDELYRDVRSGKVVGMVVIPMYRHGSPKQYAVRTSGLADDNLTLAVGAMSSCQALLQESALTDAGLLGR